MHDAPSAPDRPRQLSGPGKILLLLLVVYAVGLILPDTLRPTALYRMAYYLAGFNPDAQSPSSGWYPLGIVCFTADNDGKVTSVDECGPTQDPRQHQLEVGDQIDLSKTAITDRRAVIQGGGWVPHYRPVLLQIVGTNGALTPNYARATRWPFLHRTCRALRLASFHACYVGVFSLRHIFQFR